MTARLYSSCTRVVVIARILDERQQFIGGELRDDRFGAWRMAHARQEEMRTVPSERVRNGNQDCLDPVSRPTPVRSAQDLCNADVPHIEADGSQRFEVVGARRWQDAVGKQREELLALVPRLEVREREERLESRTQRFAPAFKVAKPSAPFSAAIFSDLT